MWQFFFEKLVQIVLFGSCSLEFWCWYYFFLKIQYNPDAHKHARTLPQECTHAHPMKTSEGVSRQILRLTKPHRRLPVDGHVTYHWLTYMSSIRMPTSRCAVKGIKGGHA